VWQLTYQLLVLGIVGGETKTKKNFRKLLNGLWPTHCSYAAADDDNELNELMIV
jgi:hypothetical protein